MPPTITVDQIKGFSLFMLKAVLDGRGNEIIDLASQPGALMARQVDGIGREESEGAEVTRAEVGGPIRAQ